MKKRVLVLLISVALFCIAGSLLAAVECDCTSQPIKPDPPCMARCVTGLMVIANERDLVEYFNLDSETVSEILKAKSGIRPHENISSRLPEKQRISLASAFDKVSDQKLCEFVSKKSEDARARAKLIELNLSAGSCLQK